MEQIIMWNMYSISVWCLVSDQAQHNREWGVHVSSQGNKDIRSGSDNMGLLGTGLGVRGVEGYHFCPHDPLILGICQYQE